ncbi:MAG: transketolase C-terminal domain-containing protein, partial [bacterium]
LGDMIPLAISVADRLVIKGYSAGVVNGRFVTPLDEELVGAQAKLARAFVTLENGVANGGFGSAITECLSEIGYPGRVIRNGWPNEFVPHGATAILMEKYGLTAGAITERVIQGLDG